MKFATIIVSALAACISFPVVAAAPVTVELERRAPGLASHLQGAGTFYRAVTRKEVPHIANYPKGKPPKDYLHIPGDFSHDGALYVFAVSSLSSAEDMDVDMEICRTTVRL